MATTNNNQIFQRSVKIVLVLLICMQLCYAKKYSECKPSGRLCLNKKQLIFCIIIGTNHTYVGCITTCPKGYVCDDHGYIACQPKNSPHTTTTTTTHRPDPGPHPGPHPPKPACHKCCDRYPGPRCYQYYQCVKIHNKYVAELRDCPRFYGYDAHHQRCVDEREVNCCRCY